MKGKYPKQELEELLSWMGKCSVSSGKLKVPGLSAERHAVIIYKK